jgi:bifunctional N-acetylglucosamine-1-phosphate-uridyltransferase/glucosamine-1-phosphate-acetyltransferase GlmU-like protein
VVHHEHVRKNRLRRGGEVNWLTYVGEGGVGEVGLIGIVTLINYIIL